jgi:hypothetical protein
MGCDVMCYDVMWGDVICCVAVLCCVAVICCNCNGCDVLILFIQESRHCKREGGEVSNHSDFKII